MLKNEKGFTLIEIIAVLVILGILAAVAIPRYVDLMNSSREAAAATAIAEIQARASNLYASNLLKSVSPNECADVVTLVNTSLTTQPIGDFTLDPATLACSGKNIPIIITKVKTKDLNNKQSGTWVMPVQ